MPYMMTIKSLDESERSVQRTFGDLSQDESADIERVLMLARTGWSGAYGWEKLLKSQRILIVSEAGAGKTHECRSQQRRLWKQGEPAFYLDLAQLSTNNLRDLLSMEEESRLDAWVAAQSDVATFFLDSIDELKLSQGSFETALKRLSKAVSGQLGRIRIVITTRPISVDSQLIREYLPVPDPVEFVASGDAFADIATGHIKQHSRQTKEDITPVWRTVALMPLSDEQIREMAAAEGIEDADALLTDIRVRNAEDFARRPQDLIELCADWREHRRIRTHREQVDQNIRVKLKPAVDRREPAQLSPDKALEGASRLALAALLTRKLTIRLSVDADRGGETGSALDPDIVLHDWLPEERETLLERALFGFASYGRVRFHHRSVVEFLAAHRLANRLNHGMPIKAVKRLLLTETSHGIKVVRPNMRPVAAWLAASNQSVFSEVRDREPGVLLAYGDPESLSLQQRVDALSRFVCVYGQGGWRGLNTPHVQVRRFASADLADAVRDLWGTGIENAEVRELLLDLIGAGLMAKCADIAHNVVIDELATNGERLGAIDALVSLGDSRLETLAQSLIGTSTRWPDELVRGAVMRLFPHHITPGQLCEVLKCNQKSGEEIDEIEWILPISEKKTTPDYLEAILPGITDLIVDNLNWRKEWPHLISGRAHLVPLLAEVCLQLIHFGKTSDEILRSSVISLRLNNDEYSYNNPSKSLREALAELHPPLREKVFWADDSFMAGLREEADPWLRLVRALHEGPLSLSFRQDGSWVRRILADSNRSLLERTMMLEISMRGISDGIGAPHEQIEHLRQYVVDRPELTILIDRRLAPRNIDPEEARLEARIKRQSQVAEARKAKGHASWVAFWRMVADDPQTAFSPDRAGNTAWNLWQAMRRSGGESRASGWSRRFIEQYFGKEVADRLRISMQTIWRNDRPTLPYERPVDERNTILIRWQLGLAAIAAESEDIGWVRKLTVEEAELATRYAPIELNGFPVWLEALASEHPVAVERTLGPELAAELERIAGQHTFDVILQAVSHAPAVVMQLFLPRLRVWLDSYSSKLRDGEDEVAAQRRLGRVLEILLKHSDNKSLGHIRAIAERQLEVADDRPLNQMWLATMMQIDPPAGTDILERLLSTLEPVATGAAINFIGVMFGDRNGGLQVDLKNSRFTPALLLRLVRLAYQYVPPSDDIFHKGAYSPGPRDDAQTGRSALLGAILDAKGSDAWVAKLEMSADPLFAHFSDRVEALAREKAAEEADDAIFTELGVAGLNLHGEASPTTRDDMFSLLLDRLDDLDDLLLQDVSPRAGWAQIQEEKVMRQLIAHELQNMSNSVYTVDQEAVTADEKETDIRLRAASSGQQSTIELKIGEKWSGRELRDTIKNQLVIKYMAAENSRSGCLLVTVSGERKWEHPETGTLIGVDELQAMLDEEATRIIHDMGGCLRVTAKVLDLRPRLATEAKTVPRV